MTNIHCALCHADNATSTPQSSRICLQDVAVVKDTAAQAVAEFIRSPDLFQFDLFESPAITQLKGDSKYGHLYALLEIVLNGDLQVSSL